MQRLTTLIKNFDPYKAAYGSMPAHATANPAIQQMYINGHFCYAYKFGIVTNGLGIVRDITFYNKDFQMLIPNIIVEKKLIHPRNEAMIAESMEVLDQEEKGKTAVSLKENRSK